MGDAKEEKKNNETKSTTASFMAMFSCCTPTEKIWLAFGVFFACVQGLALPAFSILFGDAINTLGSGFNIIEEMDKLAINFCLIGAGIFVCAAGQNAIFSYMSKSIGARLRIKYMHSILGQDVAWFDVRSPGEIPTAMDEDIHKVEEATGIQCAMFFLNTSTAVFGVATGFWKGWQVALVMLSALPLMAASGAFMAQAISQESTTTRDGYAKAAGVAEEVIGSMRTVAAFGGEVKETSRYTSFLEIARKGSTRAQMKIGMSMGFMWGSFFWAEALTFWYGGTLIRDQVINPGTDLPYTGGDIMAVLFSVLMGAFGLGQMGPALKSFAAGRVAMGFLTQTMKEKPEVEPRLLNVSMKVSAKKNANNEISVEKPYHEAKSIRLESLALEKVSFRYPARPSVQVLDNVSLSIQRGQKVAFVGESGSGKSTMVALFERLYDPDCGRVLLNGEDIKSIAPHTREHLRTLFGYVGQEPVMFATSIYNNCTYGLEPKPSVSAVEEACKKANCWEFIAKFPAKLDTFCGASSASQMSGGQKQRLAIARALLRKPQVLLLDEATSALDNESEKLVQQTIDGLMKGEDALTTINIAHRLSTVRNSDVIFVLQRGKLMESGSHADLLAKEGIYSALVKTQQEGMGDEAAQTAKRESFTRQDSEVEMKKLCSQASMKSTTESVQDEDAVEKKRIEDIAKVYKPPFQRLLGFNSGEKWVYGPGLLGGVLNGSAMPVFAYLLSDAMRAMYTLTNLEELETLVNENAIKFAFAGLFVWVGSSLQGTSFSYLQGYFVKRIRSQVFAKFMEQDMTFHDDPNNTPGRLTASLQSYAQKMSALTGTSIGVMVQAFASLIVGLVIAFIASAELTGVLLATIPVLILAGMLEFAVYMGLKASNEANKQASTVASEALLNLKTVRAAGAEQDVLNRYAILLSKPVNAAARKSLSGGIAFGFSQASYFFIYGFGFWYGGRLVEDGTIPFNAVLEAMMGVILGAAGMGQAMSFLPNMAEAKTAAHDVFNVLDADTKNNAVEARTTKDKEAPPECKTIEFKDVYFTYPHRQDVQVLNGLSFKVKAGQKVALVGPSGGGKSTVISLLQRFYEPSRNVKVDEELVAQGKKPSSSAGQILIDERELSTINVAAWRENIGYVGQEPVLFDLSLAENTTYGKEGATTQEMESVAAKANMNDFILSETATQGANGVRWSERLGTKGGLLSGGQKQRTAIARALIRNPKILLLDEATSALDSNSEKQVQDAIDHLREQFKGSQNESMTMFVIAHRLSTIKDSDIILVIAEGRLVESGTHDELISLKGVYRDLYERGQQ